MSTQDSSKAYVGFKSCGCAVAAMIAGIESERSERAELRRWTKQGYHIQVMHPDEARQQPGFLGCVHKVNGYVPTMDDQLTDLMTQARS